MKTTIKLLITSIIFTTLSCSKNQDETPVYTPTKAALTNLYNANFEALKQTATFDASNTNFVFTSNAGTTLTINGTCLRKGSDPVTGNVDLEFYEIYDRGTMAITNKPTMGYDGTDLVPIETGGEFLIKVKQNGVELKSICGFNLSTPASITGGIKSGMQGFMGSVDSNGELTWAQAQGNDFWVTTNPDKYNTFLSQFGWFNYDRFPVTGPRTSITVNIPSKFVNASTVFLSTKLKPGELGGIGGKWNIGLECNIIMLSEENGNFRYAVKSITVVNNQVVTFNESELSNPVTPAQMKQTLNNLP